MKLLLLHCDYLEYECREKTKFAEDVEEERKKGRMEELLVAFNAVEKGDAEKPDEVAAGTIAAIQKMAQEVKTKKVCFYPYAHLSSELARPDFALSFSKRVAGMLSEIGFEVVRPPFGWYKAFSLRCKGHPISEGSKTITGKEADAQAHIEMVNTALKASGKSAEVIATPSGPAAQPAPQAADSGTKEIISEALKKEDALKTRFYIYTPDDKLIEVKDFDFFGHPALEAFKNYEIKKERIATEEPPHIKLMREHELVDIEPGSDQGNLRWYPKGKLIKKLLERRITDVLEKYGAMEVETPIMYDFEHPSLKKYLNRFPARQYIVLSDEKKYFLRFAACFGQFLMTHDTNISYRHLPLRMFEMTRYSFRREKSGEVSGLRRLRAFTMQDMHTLCADIPSAKEEFKNQFKMAYNYLGEIGIEYETAFRIQTDFFKEHRGWYHELVSILNKPILIEMFDERYAYFITKFEFNFIDNNKKASALSTVQIDVENCETYDLTYTGPDGKQHRPIILHASICGAIERDIFALLETEASKIKSGRKGSFPYWLTPTQVRFCPVGEEFVAPCREMASRLSTLCNGRVRIDLDDTEDKVGKKIRNAEKEWVFAILVVGKKELETGKLSVR
ncbi:MAG: threonine--tRNA ligase, partial [Thermoplasmata archaeon]